MDPLIAAASAGNESAFSELVGRYRNGLQAHAYRIMGSYEESEDLTQETFLRAWRMRESFQGRSSYRTWLYRIATNACFSALARRTISHRTSNRSKSRGIPHDPDRLLESIATTDAEPDTEVACKETIELALLVAVQHLPPRQRSVLIARDVLGWSAKETASLLGSSDAAVNSALQRARATLRTHLPPGRLEWAPASDASEEQRALLARYVDAVVRADTDALGAILCEDAGLATPAELRRLGAAVPYRPLTSLSPHCRDAVSRTALTRTIAAPAAAIAASSDTTPVATGAQRARTRTRQQP